MLNLNRASWATCSMLALLLTITTAHAQQVSFTENTTKEIADIQRKSLEELANDLPQLGKYREANAQLPPLKPGEHRVVFFGDSLTEGWGMARNGSVFFPGKPYVNRGISGQTTLQMVVRFRQDVIDLHPDVVMLLAGTNDLAGNMGPASLKTITDNLQSMIELARANKIRVVLCSELPTDGYRWRPDSKPAEPLKQLNVWLKKYASDHGLIYVDYYTLLATESGAMKPEYASDGVHPNKLAYSLMAPLAEAGIAEALKRQP